MVVVVLERDRFSVLRFWFRFLSALVSVTFLLRFLLQSPLVPVTGPEDWCPLRPKWLHPIQACSANQFNSLKNQKPIPNDADDAQKSFKHASVCLGEARPCFRDGVWKGLLETRRFDDVGGAGIGSSKGKGHLSNIR